MVNGPESLRIFVVAAIIQLVIAPSPGAAQTTQQPGSPQSVSASTPPDQAAQPDDDAKVSLPEPDWRIVNLPTTLRLPKHRSSFELTHRFNGNLAAQSFSQNLSNFFGLDQGAVIGFEYRYAVVRHVQAIVYRGSLGQTFEFSGKYDAIHQHAGAPLSISTVVSVEGTQNFHHNHQPAVAVVFSRFIGSRLAVYGEPTYVWNAASEIGSSQGTSFIGVGARARVLRWTYLVVEVSPRVSGYRPGEPEYGFGIESRVGGHVFQLNFTNGSANTPGQLARGGFPNSLFLGFNLTRKFF